MMSRVKRLVSVSIPFYNCERYLSEAIESVLAQSYSNWELLLVDDGSTDRSTEIARGYAAKWQCRIAYLEHSEHRNRGLTCSRNLGARNSTGEYLAFLDSDDVWSPHKLRDQIAIMEAHPEAGLIYGLSEYWHDWEADGEGQQENHVPLLAPGEKLYLPPTLLQISSPLGAHRSPCPSSFLLRFSAFDKVGGFEECFNPKTHQLYEDMAFLVKAYLNIPVFVSSCCWDRYRCRRLSMMHSLEGTIREESARQYFFRWLWRYLHPYRIAYPGIWRAFRRKAWVYWLPIGAHGSRLLRRLRNQISH